MSNRKGLIGAAACAALALSGWVQANEAATIAPASPELAKSVVLAEAGEPSYDPLMSLLVKTGPGKALAENGITVGGRIQGSLTYSASNPPDNFISGRVFDFEHEDLTLNQIGVFVNKGIDKTKFDVGGRMEWIYGGDSRLIHSLGLFDHYNDDATPDDEQWDLNQIYADISFGNGIWVRAGKFITHVGHETIDPTGNAFYSHTYSFGFGIPFTHSGVQVNWMLNESTSAMLGVTRGWDTSTEDNNDTVDFIGQISVALDATSQFTFNFTTGADQTNDNDNWRTLINLMYKQKVGDNLVLAVDAIYGYEANSQGSAEGSDAVWWGVAGYMSYIVDPMLTVNGRLEYFNDGDGARLTGAVGGTNLYAATLGVAITPMPNHDIGKGLVIRPEIRFDYSDESFFDGGTDYYQLTAAVDAIFRF